MEHAQTCGKIMIIFAHVSFHTSAVIAKQRLIYARTRLAQGMALAKLTILNPFVYAISSTRVLIVRRRLTV